MIVSAFISLAFLILDGIVSLLPNSTGFPQGAHDAVSGLGGYFGMFAPILPMSTLATCVGLIFSVEIAIFGFKSIKWIVSHIPWVGGHGN